MCVAGLDTAVSLPGLAPSINDHVELWTGREVWEQGVRKKGEDEERK